MSAVTLPNAILWISFKHISCLLHCGTTAQKCVSFFQLLFEYHLIYAVFAPVATHLSRLADRVNLSNAPCNHSRFMSSLFGSLLISRARTKPSCIPRLMLIHEIFMSLRPEADCSAACMILLPCSIWLEKDCLGIFVECVASSSWILASCAMSSCRVLTVFGSVVFVFLSRCTGTCALMTRQARRSCVCESIASLSSRTHTYTNAKFLTHVLSFTSRTHTHTHANNHIRTHAHVYAPTCARTHTYSWSRWLVLEVLSKYWIFFLYQ